MISSLVFFSALSAQLLQLTWLLEHLSVKLISGEEINSGSTISSNPAVVGVQNTSRVTVSDFSYRMKGIRVRATGENPILVVINYNDFGFFRSLIGSSSYLVRIMNVAAGTTHSITLNRFQTLGFSNVADLTGTKSVSDKPYHCHHGTPMCTDSIHNRFLWACLYPCSSDI